MVSVGTRLGGKYRLERLLGEGGMGAVYAAENENTGRRVAVKVLHGEWMQRPEVAQRFIREARATTAIAHPNIVEVLDLDTDPTLGVTYIVQELLEGQTLESYLEAHSYRRLTPADVLEIMVPVMGALVAAHAKGIVHRDLKPANIFLPQSRDGSWVPKVIDFGIAKDIASASGVSNHTREGTVIGTPEYMSPEQVKGLADLDARTDVWSVGVLLYEMLSRRRPYEGPHHNVVMAKILYEVPTPLASLRPDLSPSLLAVVDGALQRDRAARFPTMRAMLAALLECQPTPHAAEPANRASWMSDAASIVTPSPPTAMPTPAVAPTLVALPLPVSMSAPRVPDTMNAVERPVPPSARRHHTLGIVALVVLGVGVFVFVVSLASKSDAPRIAAVPVTPTAVARAAPAPALVTAAPVAPTAVAPAPAAATPVAPASEAPAPAAPATVLAAPRIATPVRSRVRLATPMPRRPVTQTVRPRVTNGANLSVDEI